MTRNGTAGGARRARDVRRHGCGTTGHGTSGRTQHPRRAGEPRRLGERHVPPQQGRRRRCLGRTPSRRVRHRHGTRGHRHTGQPRTRSRPSSPPPSATRRTWPRRGTGSAWSSAPRRPRAPTNAAASKMRCGPSSPWSTRRPGVAGVRELAGLAAYRCGRWRSAAAPPPGVGDVERRGRVPAGADGLPAGAAQAEEGGRAVERAAAQLARSRRAGRGPHRRRGVTGRRRRPQRRHRHAGDRGRAKALRNPSDRHLRQWYLLADLYERAGDVPQAREYFERVLRADPEAYDVAERLRGLGPDRQPRPRRTRAPRSRGRRRRARPRPKA